MQKTDERLNANPSGNVDAELESPEGPERSFDEQDLTPRAFTPLSRSRILFILGTLGTLVLMAVLPPLVNVNRFRRQIASSIGASLGRPVRLGSVTLKMLPLPGFTLENFVVAEDPAFGAEPVIRANLVRANLRVSSLWRRRVEFSKISLDEPSVNLVHLPDGRWNVESILLQAARMQAAPTAQREAGTAPRFPYIEATGGRVNVKIGLEKMPLSLTEATFALWLQQPEVWRLRLEARPIRTDATATDTGTLRLEGTLGRASILQDVPIEGTAEWSKAPLGAVSSFLLRRDAGLRGQMLLNASVHGTMGDNAVDTRLQLNQVRRSDFVPARTLDVDLACKAHALHLFHALEQVKCAWPPTAVSSGLKISGDMPQVLRPASASGEADVNGVGAAALLDLFRLASNRISPDLTAEGTIAATLRCCAESQGLHTSKRTPVASGDFTILQARLAKRGDPAFLNDDVTGELAGREIILKPLSLDLGGPTAALLEGRMDGSGYGLHLSGLVARARLLEFAGALPQFGDGLAEQLPPALSLSPATEAPLRVDLVSIRAWGGPQSWAPSPVAKPVRRRKGSRHRLAG